VLRPDPSLSKPLEIRKSQVGRIKTAIGSQVRKCDYEPVITVEKRESRRDRSAARNGQYEISNMPNHSPRITTMRLDVHPSEVGHEHLVAILFGVEDHAALLRLMLVAEALGAQKMPSSSGMLNRGRLLIGSSPVLDRSWMLYRLSAIIR